MLLKLKEFNFYYHKSPTFLKSVDIEKVLVSNKIPCGVKRYKWHIGYFYNDHEVEPLHIVFPKASVYVKSRDGQINWIYLIQNDYLWEKYNAIWDKVSTDVKKKKNLISSLSIIKKGFWKP